MQLQCTLFKQEMLMQKHQLVRNEFPGVVDLPSVTTPSLLN